VTAPKKPHTKWHDKLDHDPRIIHKHAMGGVLVAFGAALLLIMAVIIAAAFLGR
jgi:hypothetical protein